MVLPLLSSPYGWECQHLTLKGKINLSRFGYSINNLLNLNEFIAKDKNVFLTKELLIFHLQNHDKI